MAQFDEERLARLEASASPSSELAALCADLRESRSEAARLEGILREYQQSWGRWRDLTEKLSALAMHLAEHDQAGALAQVEELARALKNELSGLRDFR
jgi:hypothetical protein